MIVVFCLRFGSPLLFRFTHRVPIAIVFTIEDCEQFVMLFRMDVPQNPAKNAPEGAQTGPRPIDRSEAADTPPHGSGHSFEVDNLQNLNEIKQLTLKAHLLCNMKTLHPGAVPKTIGHSRCSSR